MKKILCTLMSIMMILAVATGCGQTGGDASSAQTGETGTKVITNCDGTEVTVVEADDDWSLIDFQGNRGYMRNEDLQFVLTEDYI